MASNTHRWQYDMLGANEPLILPGNFAAGSSQAVKMGEILELTGNSSTEWVPMDSDYSMDSDVAVAAVEIKSGDLAGYYPIIVPRPGDVFRFALAAAGNSSLGTSLYWSDSETVTVTTGSNILGTVAGHSHYPQMQGHASDDASVDQGTTILSVSTVDMVFEESNSFYSLIQTG